jgi:multiple sugar transport system permease protein
VIAQPTAPSTPSRRPRRKVNVTAYLFALPYVALLLLVGVFPTVYALVLSFLEPRGGGFAGFANYLVVLGDYRFGQTILNVLSFIAIWLPLMVGGVLLVSFLLDVRPGQFSNALRTIYYLPGAVSSTAAVLLWISILDPTVSPFSWLLAPLGKGDVFGVVNAIGLPTVFSMMAFLAGAGGWIVVMGGALSSISAEIIEAARIDGCNNLQLALKIKLPLILKNVVFMLILSFSSGFQLFAEPQIISAASSGTIATANWTPNQLAYTYAFGLGNFGVGAALSSLLTLVGVLIALWMIFKTDFYRTDA